MAKNIMAKQSLINQIIQGDSIQILKTLPRESVDVVFADPPYNLQLKQDLWRPDHSKVDAVNDKWDQFGSYDDYDAFTRAWLEAVRPVMKSRSSIWISGTYHNIFRVGKIMQDIGFWLLNTVVWHKTNPMPNFNGTRLKNDVEFIIWAKKSEKSTYHFNYQLMKHFNEGKQLGSVWVIPICNGGERLTDADGNKLHSTQKPEELLRRILLAAGKPNAVVLDPFSGSGTTAAVAKGLHMKWIGIERDERYIEPSRQRIDMVIPISKSDSLFRDFAERRQRRVAFRELVKNGYLEVGQTLYLDQTEYQAEILTDGTLKYNGTQGSIHWLSKELKGIRTCNGWKQWRYEDAETGELVLIDALRDSYRLQHYDSTY